MRTISLLYVVSFLGMLPASADPISNDSNDAAHVAREPSDPGASWIAIESFVTSGGDMAGAPDKREKPAEDSYATADFDRTDDDSRVSRRAGTDSEVTPHDESSDTSDSAPSATSESTSTIVTTDTAVPEPATLGLFFTGAAGLLWKKRRGLRF